MIFQNEMAFIYVNALAGCIVGLAGLYIAVHAYRKDPTYIGNRLLSVSNLFVLFYGISVIIEQITENEVLIGIFGRFEYVFVLFSVILLFLTMMVIINSSKWLENNRLVWTLMILALGFTLILFLWDGAAQISTDRNDVFMNTFLMLFFSAFVVIALSSSGIILYKYAQKTTGQRRKKMMLAGTGYIVNFGSLSLDILGSLYPENYIIELLFYLVYATGMILIGLGFSTSTTTQESK